MKKRILLLIILSIIISFSSGCQEMAKNYGGSMTIELEPGTKLELITWKDNSLWYCTRPMRDDEEAEVHTYQEQSEFRTFEGTITIKETKMVEKNER